jgi:hypothetical protein
MKKKTTTRTKKKLVLAKETLSLINAPVGGAITDLCNTFRCPTDPNWCQSGAYPC